MQVITNYRPRTIKEKKESLISSRTSNNSSIFATPVKGSEMETPIRLQQHFTAGSLKLQKTPALHVTLSAQKSQKSLKLHHLTDLPANPLRKIKSIKDLEPLHESMSVCKSKYKFKADENLSSSVKQGHQSNKKDYNDKIPINILAIQESISQRPKTLSRSKSFNSKFSQSKIIKSLIIHKEESD